MAKNVIREISFPQIPVGVDPALANYLKELQRIIIDLASGKQYVSHLTVGEIELTDPPS